MLLLPDEIARNVTTDGAFAIRWSIVMAFPTLSNLLALWTNALLVAVTVFSKKLRSTCHFLIAFDAFCYAITRFPYFLSFLLVCIRHPIRLIDCSFLMAVALIGNRTSIFMMLFLGIERCVAVLFPIWSRSRNQRKYAFWTCIFSVLLHAPFSIYQCLSVGFNAPERLLLCSSIDVVAGGGNNFIITILNNGVMGGTIIVYTLLWLKIKFASSPNASKTNKKIFNSLAVYVSLNCVCSLSVPITLSVLPSFALSPLTFYTFGQEIQIAAFLTNALMPICLYTFSKLYRNEFNKFFAVFGIKLGIRH
ncbi:hypothetical protein niasHS_001120 [Heterodera schachtii]|uniref:G-protein coupled receptors family 1 profile domain-containing protein n=1 Tax=Heterodera schachtii TaxID=97005 RepID=A0ABD2KDI8_HETSC